MALWDMKNLENWLSERKILTNMANDNKGEIARILSSLLLVTQVTMVPWFVVKQKRRDIMVIAFVLQVEVGWLSILQVIKVHNLEVTTEKSMTDISKQKLLTGLCNLHPGCLLNK